jgi:hypothetical protein
VAARLAELWAAREHVLVTKRVQIRGPEAPDAPNQNPVLDGIAADGSPIAEDAPPQIATGKRLLTPVLPADADAVRVTYTKLDAAGQPLESAREDWVYSWFSTAGDLEDLHTRDPEAEEWTIAASDAGASGGRALVACAGETCAAAGLTVHGWRWRGDGACLTRRGCARARGAGRDRTARAAGGIAVRFDELAGKTIS